MDFVSARQNMVESQVRTNDVTDVTLQRALRTVARERFCAPARAFCAYAELPCDIAPGRQLMIARDLSKLLQALKAKPGERALAIAAPYAGAVLAEMGLRVVAQEADGRAAAVLHDGLSDYGVELVIQDLATPAGADFDIIVCEAAVAVAPDAWIKALKIGGRMALVERDGPVGRARLFVRTEAGVSGRDLFDATPPLLAGFERAATFQF